MININILINMLFALLIFWQATILIIQKKKIGVFLVFLIIGLTYSFQSSFTFYNIFSNVLWTTLTWVQVVSFIIIFIYLVNRRKEI